MKRTKIICTIGPASEGVDTIRKMLRAGMNYARLNLSHATLGYHKKLIKNVRQAAKLENQFVGLIADLQGPKIRLGELPKEGVELKKNSKVIFAPTHKFKNNELPLPHRELFHDLKSGERILIDDGLIELKILKIGNSKIHAEVITQGKVTSHKGINLPDSKLRLKSLSLKDRKDVKFAISENVEWIALSFVRSARDVEDLRKLIKKHPQKIIAKIEKGEAVKNIDEIISVVDGIMVARGDLGIEIPAERVPIIQKDIISKCLRAGKPVVVATQMLDSMIRNPRPTRAEVSDVANAVIDHTDAVMLSGESAGGAYPMEAVKIMCKIVLQAEQSRYDDFDVASLGHRSALVLASAEAAAHLAQEAKTKYIYIEGDWASELGQAISHFRPETPILVKTLTHFEAAQISLNWGITSFISPKTFKVLCKRGSKALFINATSNKPAMMRVGTTT